jgi:hypothetical protein
MKSLLFRVCGLFRLTVLVAVFLLRPDLTFAQFIGPYTLEPPVPGPYFLSGVNPFGTLTVGSWTAHISTGPGFGINTTGSPDSLVLSGFASLRPAGGWISTRAAASGVVTFDYTITGVNDGVVEWFNSGSLDQGPARGTTVTAVTTLNSDLASDSITVNEGDYFGFLVVGNSGFGPPQNDGSRTFTIQNFSAPVPEPSPVAIFTAATIIGSAVTLRKRRAPQSR